MTTDMKTLRALLAGLFAICAAIVSAQAGFLINSYQFATPAPVLEFQTSVTSTANSATYTFNTVDIGTPDPDRFVVVCTAGLAGSSTSISSITLDGVTMTELRKVTGTTAVGCYGLIDAADTTDTIVVTFGASRERAIISVQTVTGLSSTTPVDTGFASGADPVALNLDTSHWGVGVVIAICGDFVTSSVTWAGVSENFDSQFEGATVSGGSASGVVAATPRTVSCDFASSGSDEAGVSVSLR